MTLQHLQTGKIGNRGSVILKAVKYENLSPAIQGLTFVPKLASSGLPSLSEPVVVQTTRPCQSASERPRISTLTVKVRAPLAPSRCTNGIACE